MVFLITLLSISSFFSPGPFVPTPPPNLDIVIPNPISLLLLYFNWANSTCNFASLVLALLAKISKIKVVLSITLQPVTSSIIFSCKPLNSSSKIKRFAFLTCLTSANSWTFPEPIRNTGSGLLLFWKNLPTTFTSQAEANSSSSFRYSSSSIPIKRAYSLSSSVIFLFFRFSSTSLISSR